ncbi:hypothetical protein B0H10DRAFT_750974 [Mycena sp. CBHHK59/15]|nr:hypothetical protein B0H10DRAFT_750974 [Mycena sp. CBHHK59/15]
MVIEWTSTEPVWVDTLRPTRVRSQSPVDVEIIDADAEPEESPAAQSIEIIDVDAEPTNLPPPSPPNATSLVRSPSVSSDVLVDSADPVQDEQTLMQQLSLEYIQKYILAFDHDRPALADAYTEDAIFSFRSNTRAAPAHFTFQRVRQAQLKSTMPKLPALQDYRFAAHGGVIDVDYDTVVLETQPLKIILSVHGELVGAAARRLAIDQSFVLRRAAADVDTAEDIAGQRRGAATWPLVAESHQMIVRDASGKVPVSMPWWMDS